MPYKFNKTSSNSHVSLRVSNNPSVQNVRLCSLCPPSPLNVAMFNENYPQGYMVGDTYYPSISIISTDVLNYTYVNPQSTTDYTNGYINFLNTTDEYSISFKIYMNPSTIQYLAGISFWWNDYMPEDIKSYYYQTNFVDELKQDEGGYYIVANCHFNSDPSNEVNNLTKENFIISSISTDGYKCGGDVPFFRIYNE